MLRFDTKDNKIYYGESHADMNNKVLGTHFFKFQDLTNKRKIVGVL